MCGRIKIEKGYYFGMRYSEEKIKEFEIEEGKKLLHKGDGEPKFYDEDSDDVEITVEGKIKTISRKSAKALNLIN